jgi:hypothetical protein
MQEQFVTRRGHVPGSYEETKQYLDTEPDIAAKFARLDKQIRAANVDGKTPILTLYQANPSWAATGDADPYGRPISRKFPADRSVNSPWGWFIAYLMARYSAAMNPPPRPYIACLEPLNEPNTLWWPQENVECYVADMAYTAEAWAFMTGLSCLLLPATADKPDPPNPRQPLRADRKVTDWWNFTSLMLQILQQWNPRVPVVWSHHNYTDIEDLNNGWEQSLSRVHKVHQRLGAYGWKGSGRSIFLTEGGYRIAYEAQPVTGALVSKEPRALYEQAQADALLANANLMHGLSDVQLFTNYGVNDHIHNKFKCQLFREWNWESAGQGAPRTAFFTWRDKIKSWPT